MKVIYRLNIIPTRDHKIPFKYRKTILNNPKIYTEAHIHKAHQNKTKQNNNPSKNKAPTSKMTLF